jgi:hypothetical protein
MGREGLLGVLIWSESDSNGKSCCVLDSHDWRVGANLLVILVFAFVVDYLLDFLRLQQLEDHGDIIRINKELCKVLEF